MKTLTILLLGVVLIFAGYSKTDTLDPELKQSDQLTSALKNGDVKTTFTGQITPVDLETGEWYDKATDWRVTGQSFWYTTNEKELKNGKTKLSGTAVIIVDNGGGEWAITWKGMAITIPEGTIVEATGEGIGTKGSVKGLKAHWKYYMNTTEGFFYNSEGFIIDKKKDLSKTQN